MRGRFTRFSGTIETRDVATDSQVTLSIDATSVETDHPQRNEHVRSTAVASWSATRSTSISRSRAASAGPERLPT